MVKLSIYAYYLQGRSDEDYRGHLKCLEDDSFCAVPFPSKDENNSLPEYKSASRLDIVLASDYPILRAKQNSVIKLFKLVLK
jgi:hypothetical protein